MDECTLCTRPSPHYLVWPGNKAKCGHDVAIDVAWRVQSQSFQTHKYEHFSHVIVMVLLHSYSTDRTLQFSNMVNDIRSY